MIKNILTGMMRPVQVCLAPEGAGGTGGGSNASGGQQQQQQQQQNDDQQQQDYKSPLDDVDADLLDDETAEKVQKANAELQRLQKLVATQTGLGDTVTKLQQEIARLQQGQQQQNQQQQQNNEPTFEDEVYDELVASGYPKDNNTRAIAKANAKVFARYSERSQEHFNKQLEPLAGRVIEQQLTQDFQALQEANEAMEIPEVAQEVWNRVNNMSKKGLEVNQAVMHNVMKMVHYDYLQNPNQQNQQQQQQRQTAPPPRMNQQGNGNGGSTRHTYPGAGHMVRTPNRSASTGDDLDPETKAALSTVTQIWDGYDWKARANGKQATNPRRR